MSIGFETALAAVSERLADQELEHSKRVARTAADLARTYGVDVENARLAGLLHDWARDRPDAELLVVAEELELAISDVERAVPYLLHARIGAAEIERTWPDAPRDVVSAVASHTLGSADPSPVEMIVYVADMLEPERTFQGVGSLRDAVGEASLKELYALAYQDSLLHLVRTRRHIHPATVSVWNSIVDDVGG